MADDSSPQRLSRINTRWSIVCRAHSGPGEAAKEAQAWLLERYGGAIQRYLLAALHDAQAAEDLTAEFSLRFIQGDFRNVNPQRGRFRDYVKTVLFRMVAHYYKERQAQPVPLTTDVAAPVGLEADPDRDFLDSWRGELLDRAFQALAALEAKTGQPYHTVLRLHLEHAEGEWTSKETAEQLSAQLGRPFTDAGVRKLKQRAREKLAEFLLDDIRHSLEDPTAQDVEQELKDLDLLDYGRPALEQRGALERLWKWLQDFVGGRGRSRGA
jgi:RNA polymerase sigma-70 factor (ECF subfamily)